MRPPQPIPRMPCPTAEAFERDWIRPRRPAVFTGALEGSVALERWDLDYLERVEPNARVAFSSSNQIYADLLGLELDLEGVEITLKHFLQSLKKVTAETEIEVPEPGWTQERLRARNRLVCGDNSCGTPLYLPLIPLSEFETLGADIHAPDFFADGRANLGALWVGTSMGSLHYDTSEGLLCQLHARKSVLLFHHGDAGRLYLNGPLHKMPNHSRIGFFHSVESILQSGFPKARDVPRWTCELGPGDALFIPNGWFHAIFAEPTSVSASFWRQPRRHQRWLRRCNARVLLGRKLKRVLNRPVARYFSLR